MRIAWQWRRISLIACAIVIPVMLPVPATAVEGLFPVIAMPAEMGADPVIVERQNLLHPIASSIRDLGTSSDPEFSVVVVDALDMSITVYRAGSEFQSARALYEPLLPSGVTLRFVQAVMSLRDVDALDRELSSIHEQLASQGVRLTVWGPEEYGGSYVVKFDPKYTPLTAEMLRADSSDSAGDARSADSSVLQRALASGNELVLSPGEVLSQGNRESPTSPFFGGAAIHGPSFADRPGHFVTCSSGFPVRSTVNTSTYYLITAWHCFRPDSRVMYTQWEPPGNVAFGDVSSWNKGADTAFIKLRGSYRSTPHIYNGTLQTTGWLTQTATVTGWENPDAGNIVCTSGYAVGQRCNLKVGVLTHWTITNDYSTESTTVYGSGAVSLDNRAASGTGQSGGVVYRISGTGVVSAVGVDSAGSGKVTCPAGSNTSECSIRVYFGLVWTLARDNNVVFAGWA